MTTIAIPLALAAAFGYGITDFLGSQGSRRTTPEVMSFLVQAVGLAAVAVALAITAPGLPTGAVLGWGAISGVGVAIGNTALYRGFGRGAVNIVAPLSGVLTAGLPAAVGLATGDHLSAAGWAGVLLTLPAIILIALSGHEPAGDATGGSPSIAAGRIRVGVGSGLLAGAGFGLLFIGLARAGPHHGLWPLLPCQVVASLVGLALVRPRRPDSAPAPARWSWRRVFPFAATAGAIGVASDLAYLTATGRGELSIVAVLTALYPAVTVLLAMAVLHERTTRRQLIGLVTAALAIALISRG